MKTHLKYLAMVCCLFGAIFELHSQGYFVPNGVTIFPGSPTGPGSEIRVLQNPTNSDYTGFFLQPQGRTPPTSLYINTFLFYPYLDEQVRTFLVSSNDPISLQPIMSQSYSELLYPNTYVFRNGIPFYLGFYTGYNPYDSHGNYTGIYTNPLFGWGEFVNNQGVIQMLGSALEYQGGGIYAGTQTIIPIPEPSTLALGALIAFLFGFRRWRLFGQ